MNLVQPLRSSEVLGILHFWRRSRLSCRSGPSGSREPYVLGASEPKTWKRRKRHHWILDDDDDHR